MAGQSIENAEVAAVFASYLPKPRRKLLALHKLILRTAGATEGVGEIDLNPILFDGNLPVAADALVRIG